jgi:hypothetical protein
MPGLGGSGGGGSISGAAVYQVFPDGHEALIRNAQIEGLNETAFKDIAAVSATQTVYNAPFLDLRGSIMGVLSGGAITPSQPPLVSVVVPDLLLEDVSINPSSGQIPTPPLSSPPK